MARFPDPHSAVFTVVITAGALLSSACDSTGPQTQPVSLSVTRKPAAAMGMSADVAVGSGPNSLNITKVEFVLAKTELSDAGTCSTPPTNNDNCNEMELAPILVDLPLDGTQPTKVLDALVPPGTYTRLQAELNAVQVDEGESGGAAFLADHPDWAGLSVKVNGVYTDGAGVPHDFTYTSGVDAEIEIPFASPIAVNSGTKNLTLVVDVARWFTDGTGAVIDPTNPANADAIGTNIKSSFGAFQDDNENGLDDHQEA
jgi:hypothetical protein